MKQVKDKNVRVREQQRDEVKHKILEWYAERSETPPKEQCEHNGEWWLEPPIALMENPVMVERWLGDAWTLSVEYRWLQ